MRREIYKSAGDFLNSPLWERLSEFKPQENNRIFISSKLENMIYHDLRKNTDDVLNDIERKAQKS